MGSCVTKIPKEHNMWLNNVNDMKHIEFTAPTSTEHEVAKSIQKINKQNYIHNIDIVQYLVSGYITELENEFASIQIPEVIRQMILLYYFQGEYFEKLGENILQSNGFMTISKIYGPSSCDLYGNWSNTTYGHNWFDSMSNKIIKWTFKINKLGTSSPEIEFGIVSTDNCQHNDFTKNRHQKLYSFANDGHSRHQYRDNNYHDLDDDEYSHSTSSEQYQVFGNKYHRKRIWNIFDDNYKQKQIYTDDNYSIPFGSGDILSIILNLKQRTLIQQINDDEQVILCKRVEMNEKIKYKLAVSMFSPKNSITFIDYHQYN